MTSKTSSISSPCSADINEAVKQIKGAMGMCNEEESHSLRLLEHIARIAIGDAPSYSCSAGHTRHPGPCDWHIEEGQRCGVFLGRTRNSKRCRCVLKQNTQDRLPEGSD